MIMCTQFGKRRTTFAKVTLNNQMDPSLRTRERLPSMEQTNHGHFQPKTYAVCVSFKIMSDNSPNCLSLRNMNITILDSQG